MRSLFSKVDDGAGRDGTSGTVRATRVSSSPTTPSGPPLGIICLLVLWAVVPIAVMIGAICFLVLKPHDQEMLFIGAGVLAIVGIVSTCIYMVQKLLRGYRLSALDRADQELKLDTAINSMHQGLVMFDRDARAVIINRRYIEMYGLSAETTKPGCTLRELLELRAALGMFSDNIDEYIARQSAHGHYGTRVRDLPDGRTISVTNRPLPNGGWVAVHEDITERRKAERAASRLFETSLDLILITDRQGNFAQVSPSSAAILGYQPEEMIGRSAVKFIYLDDLEATRNEMRAARRGRNTRNFETRYNHKDGRIVTLAWTGVWSEVEQQHFFIGRDITERKEAEEKLRYLAHYDQLTGLPNRITLQTNLAELLKSRDQVPARPTSIAMFDLDNFKTINDTLGHSVGDELLKEVAERLVQIAGETAAIYRLGGDEFVAVFPDCGDPRIIGKFVDAMIERLADRIEIGNQLHYIGASAGIAIAPTDASNVDELVANADLALYEAKSSGGRTYRLFLPVLRAQAQARRELDTELRRAFSDNEFELYFQPQIRLSDGAVVGAEALLRWRHPERGILGPGMFINAIAESPIVLEVGRWILRTACMRAADWRIKGFPLVRAGVNLFPAQFSDKTLLADVEDALRYTGLPADALELEITENIALGNDESVLEQLQALREKGVRFAFDDFGTGFASLSYLTRYPISRIKIDQSFVRKISAASENTAIVRSIIVMAHNLGLEVIAEGVETPAHAEFLQAEGCDEAQGFLYAKPLTSEDFEAYLRSQRAGVDARKTRPIAFISAVSTRRVS
jgi:diguanylate cyclase (GGDEF)-like protein/PAS domain S-box-containing protein